MGFVSCTLGLYQAVPLLEYILRSTSPTGTTGIGDCNGPYLERCTLKGAISKGAISGCGDGEIGDMAAVGRIGAILKRSKVNLLEILPGLR